jgi:hypothetical protein
MVTFTPQEPIELTFPIVHAATAGLRFYAKGQGPTTDIAVITKEGYVEHISLDTAVSRFDATEEQILGVVHYENNTRDKLTLFGINGQNISTHEILTRATRSRLAVVNDGTHFYAHPLGLGVHDVALYRIDGDSQVPVDGINNIQRAYAGDGCVFAAAFSPSEGGKLELRLHRVLGDSVDTTYTCLDTDSPKLLSAIGTSEVCITAGPHQVSIRDGRRTIVRMISALRTSVRLVGMDEDCAYTVANDTIYAIPWSDVGAPIVSHPLRTTGRGMSVHYTPGCLWQYNSVATTIQPIVIGKEQ